MKSWWDRNIGTQVPESQFIDWVGSPGATTKGIVKRHVLASGCTSVLDCGAGLCTDMEWYRLKRVAYTALDSCELFVGKARARGIQAILGSITEIPFSDGAFDAVQSRHVLEHLPSFDPALSEMIRVARKCVVNVFFIQPREFEIIAKGETGSHHDGLYHNIYRQSDIEETVKRCGASFEWSRSDDEVILFVWK